MLRRIARFCARNRSKSWIQQLDRALVKFHKGYENLNYDSRSNGEQCVLTKLANAGHTGVFFDVGANRGNWTTLVVDTFHGFQIHAFEIVPDTFAYLRRRFDNFQNVVLNDIGLADTEGNVDVNFSGIQHELATCVSGWSGSDRHLDLITRSVPVTTGDHYCRSNEIDRISFLKIDVEGFEPQVLRGFAEMLGKGRIDIIQFEYGNVNIHTHFLLKDFYTFLLSFNMRIGKIYPNYVDFRPYRYRDEDFLGPNYLAVRCDQSDLLRTLGSE